MTIDKAIDTLEDLKTTLPQRSPEERREAVQLGIEAMKRVKLYREGTTHLMVFPLPGETEK